MRQSFFTKMTYIVKQGKDTHINYTIKAAPKTVLKTLDIRV